MSPAACRSMRAVGVALLVFTCPALLASPLWVVLEGGKPDEPPEFIQVVKEKKETASQGTLVLEGFDGKNRVVEEDKILARIPVFPEGEAKVEREEAVRAITLLLEAKSKAPALEKVLQQQVEKWKALIDKMPNATDPEALAKTEEDFARAVAAAMPQAHDPMRTYTAEQLEAQIQSLGKLKKEFSVRAEEIQQLLDPWEIEAKYLREGKKKFEGRWLSSEDWERERGAREAAAKQAFLQTIRPPDISPALVGQGTVMAALAAGAAGLFFGISFLFHGVLEVMRRRAWWKGACWTAGGILVVGLIARTTGLILALPAPWERRGEGEAKVLEDLLWETVGLKGPFPREMQVRDADLNAWWAKRLHPGSLSVLEILVVRVEKWEVQFLDGGLRLERHGSLLGRPLVLRQEMTLRRTESGEEIYRVEGMLGGMPLPPAVVLRSWSQWINEVARLAQFFSAPQEIRLERLEKGLATFSAP